jgi:hypothetical protein
MKSEHPISFGKDGFGKDGAASTTGDVASTIARLKEENEILRRLATLLSAQLNLAQGHSAWERRSQ